MIVANYPGVTWQDATERLTGAEVNILLNQLQRQQQAQQRG